MCERSKVEEEREREGGERSEEEGEKDEGEPESVYRQKRRSAKVVLRW